MTIQTETIPDADSISRLVDFPRMYHDADRELIWEQVFQFPGGRSESVIWQKYAPRDEDVHRLGCEREALKRQNNLDFRYIGFITAEVGEVRRIQTIRGHGFHVDHVPAEGIQHTHIGYAPAPDTGKLKTGEKNELKYKLQKLFGPLVHHSRDTSAG